MNLVMQAPQRATLLIIGARENPIDGNNEYIRIRPYLPSFSKIPASTIDPATGASTWAFGSQRCVMYRGIFTRNAAIVINHHIGLILVRWIGGAQNGIRIDR